METNKRTIELTHEQIDIIASALFMASGEYEKEFKRICDQFPDEPTDKKIYWHVKSCRFYDLGTEIKQGKFDV